MHRILPSCIAIGTCLFVAVGCGPEYPNCDNDEDCHEGEFCVNGQCQQCRTNDDCPAGQQCNGGACEAVPGYCDSSDDCPPGQECQNNRCVAQAQTNLEQPEPTPGPCELAPVYFGFDQDALDGSARATVQANVECARQRQLGNLHLTGHTDPRGTEEYNLALGDRRARAVMEYMTSLGVEAGTVGSSSMGEEMATGSDEGSWSRDRKVSFNSQQ